MSRATAEFIAGERILKGQVVFRNDGRLFLFRGATEEFFVGSSPVDASEGDKISFDLRNHHGFITEQGETDNG